MWICAVYMQMKEHAMAIGNRKKMLIIKKKTSTTSLAFCGEQQINMKKLFSLLFMIMTFEEGNDNGNKI